MKIKKWKFKKTSPRRLLYLLTIVTIGLLGLFCNNARLKMYSDMDISHQKFLSTHLKQDTEAAQYVFYAKYRPDTDYIARVNNTGSNATFVNVCQVQCDLFKGKEILEVCNQLSIKKRFNQYRVYNCSLKISLENDQPLRCEAIDNKLFNIFCGKVIASL